LLMLVFGNSWRSDVRRQRTRSKRRTSNVERRSRRRRCEKQKSDV